MKVTRKRIPELKHCVFFNYFLRITAFSIAVLFQSEIRPKKRLKLLNLRFGKRDSKMFLLLNFNPDSAYWVKH